MGPIWQFVKGFALVVAVGGTLAVGTAQRLLWLGEGRAYDVSDDGRTVVGQLNNKPAVWDIPTNTATQVSTQNGYLIAVSASGNRAVGDLGNYQPFVWNRGVGVSNLPGACNAYCWPADITANGRFAAGKVTLYDHRPAVWDLDTNPPTYFRYTPLGVYQAEAYGISDNGRIVAGFGHASQWGYRGFVFDTVDSWAVRLDPAAGHFGCVPREISVDGAIVVGNSGDIWGGSYRPVMWRAANSWQPELLAHLGGSAGEAFDIKSDTIVGFSSLPSGQRRAARWRVSTATTRVEDLNSAYASLLGNGSRLEVAYAISRNNRYIVGWGYNAATQRTEAFLLDTWRTGDANGDGCINDADLLIVLFNFGNAGEQGDVNGDGIVNDADLLVVLFDFGQGC